VRLNWNFVPLAMFVALALFTGGCGGISASHTVSPMDFLLPGIMKNDVGPGTNAPAIFPKNSCQLATAK
jgi:hypothetical protein